MTAFLFIALVFVVVWMVFRALRGAGIGAPAITALAVLYLVIPGVLTSAHLLDRYSPLPAPALVIVMGVSIVTVVLSMSATGSRLVSTLGLPVLVGFQAFRVPVEWLLHRLYLEGVIPVQMTYAGLNFDIVSGVTAAMLGLWLMRGRRANGLVLAWNVLGLALLANIVTIAVLSTPVPFRRFLESPPHMLPSLFPYVWLPTFLVQMALAGHILVFRRLRKER